MTSNARSAARASLAIVWLGTALVSLIGLHDQSLALMQRTSLPPEWHLPIIMLGAALDAALGLALWRWHSRRVYLATGLAMLMLTITSSILLPALWLDPIGCLIKNLPLFALLLILHEDAPA